MDQSLTTWPWNAPHRTTYHVSGCASVRRVNPKLQQHTRWARVCETCRRSRRGSSRRAPSTAGRRSPDRRFTVSVLYITTSHPCVTAGNRFSGAKQERWMRHVTSRPRRSPSGNDRRWEPSVTNTNDLSGGTFQFPMPHRWAGTLRRWEAMEGWCMGPSRQCGKKIFLYLFSWGDPESEDCASLFLKCS